MQVRKVYRNSGTKEDDINHHLNGKIISRLKNGMNFLYGFNLNNKWGWMNNEQ